MSESSTRVQHRSIDQNPRRLRWFTAMVLALVSSMPCSAAPLFLTREINPGSGDGIHTGSTSASTDYLLFWGYDGSAGSSNQSLGNPWRSDGTVSGTQLIKSISTASSQSGPSTYQPSAVQVNGIDLFGFNDGVADNQLWRSDGTPAGTSALSSDPANFGPDGFLGLFPVGNTLFYASGWNCTTSGQLCVWSTNGTSAPTVAMPNSALYDRPAVVLQQFVFLGAESGTLGLYLSNGTEAGTTLLVAEGFGESFGEMVAVNDKVYFGFDDVNHGNELWVTDLTPAGTHLVKDINPGTSDSSPDHLTRVGDLLFFTALDPNFGREVWRSDGTAAGTFMLKDVNPGVANAGVETIAPFEPSSGSRQAFFFADDGTHGPEPWISDGTSNGTFMLMDIVPGSPGSAPSSLPTAVAGSKFLYFSDYDPNGIRLWATDGAVAFNVDADIYETTPLAPANGHLFVAGNKVLSYPPNYLTTGQELFEMDLLSYEGIGPHGSSWCTRPDTAIVDGATVTSRARLPAHGGVTQIDRLQLDLFHRNLGDVTVTLTHEETGKTVTLLNQPNNATSGCTGQIADILLHDSATTQVNSACANARNGYAIGGEYKPAQSLSAFIGDSVAGHWKLSVSDKSPGNAKSGTLHQWCIDFQQDHVFANGLD
jgi:ELWxxDGT repeat protein